MSGCFNNENFLFCLLRVILGVLFFFQGYDKVFKMRVAGVTQFFVAQSESAHVPKFFLRVLAWFTSFAELVGGLLLIAGLFTNYALYLLGIDLLLVVTAFSFLKPMWDMQLLFPRLVLLSILLYLPADWNVFSADHLMQLLKK